MAGWMALVAADVLLDHRASDSWTLARKIDYNCFYCVGGNFQAVVDQLRSEDGRRNAKRYNLEQWQNLGFDQHSMGADPLFVNPPRNTISKCAQNHQR